MAVPPPNDDPSWGGLVVDGLRELKEAVADLRRDMNAQMSLLVSQREFDHTRDQLTIDIAEMRSKIDSGLVRHDADIRSVREEAAAGVESLKKDLSAAEQKRRAERWAVIGTLLTILALLLTVVFHYV